MVAVVGANLVVAAEPEIQHANTPNEPLILEIIDEISSHRLHPVPNRIVSTVGRAESTTTQHRDAATLRWETELVESVLRVMVG